MKHEETMSADIIGGCRAKAGETEQIRVVGLWKFTARKGKTREVLWEETIKNLVVNNGLDMALGVNLARWTQTNTWYVGLTSGTPTIAAADTMASHGGWDEFTGYSETERPQWEDGGVSGQSIDNSAATATFTMNAAATVGGGFLTSTDSKTSAVGSLYAVGSFTAKVLSSGDTLDVTATFTSAAS